jgi:iron complex outermembrane recepter protein
VGCDSYSASFGRTALERPVIRGQSNIIGRPNASFFVDGIFLSGAAVSTEVANLERIEVIKGPQAAQYGRSTFAGAINYVTRAPSLQEFEGKATATYGQHDNLEGMLSISGPIIEDRLAFYLAARHYEFGSEYTNSFDGGELGEEESNGVTLKLRWQPGENFEANWLVTYAEDRDGPLALGFQGREWNNCQLRSAALPRARGYRCGEVIDTDLLSFRQRTDRLERGGGLERDRLRTALRLNWDFGDGYELVSATAYNAEQYKNATDQSWNAYDAFASADPAVQPAIPAGVQGLVVRQFLNAGSFWRENWEDRNDFSQELRINSPAADIEAGRKLSWSGGLYYFRADDDQTASLKTFPDGTLLVNGTGALSLEATKNTALFLSAEYNFNERWALSAEVRRGKDEISVVNLAVPTVTLSTAGGVWTQVVGGMNVALPTSVPGYTVGATPMGLFNSTTPRASLRYEPNDDATFYLTWARGNKPGGFNTGNVVLLLAQQGIDDTFDEEFVESTEIGGKFRLLDGRVQFNIAAFYNDLFNQQLTQNIAGQVGATAITGSFTSNVGESEIRGVEVEFNARLTESWDIGLGYAFTDAELIEYVNVDQADLFSPRPATFFTNGVGCFNANPPPGRLTCQQARDLDNAEYGDVAGNVPPRAPRHQGYVTTSWKRPLANGWKLSIGGDVTYEASKFDQIHNLLETGDHMYVNARIGLEGEAWSVQVWGKNLTDDDTAIDILRYIDARTPLPVAPAGSSAFSAVNSPRGFVITPPRGSQVGITATYRF